VQGSSFQTFRFSAYEAVAGIVSVVTMTVGITLWSLATFQTKEASIDQKISVDRRLDQMENEVSKLNSTILGVAIDVSYIRGRMEPKQKGGF